MQASGPWASLASSACPMSAQGASQNRHACSEPEASQYTMAHCCCVAVCLLPHETPLVCGRALEVLGIVWQHFRCHVLH